MTWFVFSIIATILFGISTALYKLLAIKAHDKVATTFWTLFGLFVFSLLFFWDHLSVDSNTTLLYSSLWGIGFTLITMLQMHALKHIETNVLFPVTTTISLIGTVLIALNYFQEEISTFQVVGVVLALIAVYFFLRKEGRIFFSKILLMIAVGIVALSIFNKIIQKVAADAINIYPFQIWQYFFGTLLALGMVLFVHKQNWRVLFSGSALSGFKIAVPAFLGGWALMVALTKGPFSLVTAIHSLYILITALVGMILFKEKLTRGKVVALLIAIIAIILIKIG